MANNIHEQIEDERKYYFPEADKLRTFRAYIAGKGGVNLTVDQKKALNSDQLMSDNVLKMVVMAAAARLELQGFESADAATKKFFDFDLFTKCQLGKESHDAHVAIQRDGNHAVGLRWLPDPRSQRGGRIHLVRENWWDGEQGVFVAYGDGEPVYAVKEWKETNHKSQVTNRRRIIFWPDHFERWVQEGSGWKRYGLPGDPDTGRGEGWVPWVKYGTTDDPIGIPIIHFPNWSPSDTKYGTSDLEGLLALQDSINMIQLDIDAAAAFTGFQMLWASGVSQGDNHRVGPGEMLTSDSEGARFGAIPAGDISKLIDAHAHKRQTVAINTQTPLHVITGADWPSGMALLRAEMPLVAKVERMAKAIGPAWVGVAHRATEIANTFGRLALSESDQITATFASAERLDDLALLEIQKAKVALYTAASAIDDPILLEKTGLFTAAEIGKIIAAQEARRAEEAALQPAF